MVNWDALGKIHSKYMQIHLQTWEILGILGSNGIFRDEPWKRRYQPTIIQSIGWLKGQFTGTPGFLLIQYSSVFVALGAFSSEN